MTSLTEEPIDNWRWYTDGVCVTTMDNSDSYTGAYLYLWHIIQYRVWAIRMCSGSILGGNLRDIPAVTGAWFRRCDGGVDSALDCWLQGSLWWTDNSQ